MTEQMTQSSAVVQPEQEQPAQPEQPEQKQLEQPEQQVKQEQPAESTNKHDQPESEQKPCVTGSQSVTEPQPESQTPIDNSHAPKIGTKIQVLWRIVHEDANNNDAMNNGSNEMMGNTDSAASGPMEEQRWWGAVVQERTFEKVGNRSVEAHKDLDVHILLYDAYGDFDEEVVCVAFLPDNVLLDLSMLSDANGGRLDWRLESDAMNDDDEDNSPAIRSAECLAREADQIVQMSGISADADLQALSRMPHEVQLHVASGYRSFADSIKRQLGELMASKPADYVVTAQDVREIMAKVRSQRQDQSGSMTGAAAQ